MGDLLVDMRLIDRGSLDAALAEQRASGRRLSRVLAERRILDEERLTKAVAAKLGLEAVSLGSLRIHERVLSLIPASVSRYYGLLPIAIKRTKQAEVLYLVMADPLDEEALGEVQRITGRQVRVLMATGTEVDQAIEEHYQSHQAKNVGKPASGRVPVLKPRTGVGPPASPRVRPAGSTPEIPSVSPPRPPATPPPTGGRRTPPPSVVAGGDTRTPAQGVVPPPTVAPRIPRAAGDRTQIDPISPATLIDTERPPELEQLAAHLMPQSAASPPPPMASPPTAPPPPMASPPTAPPPPMAPPPSVTPVPVPLPATRNDTGPSTPAADRNELKTTPSDGRFGGLTESPDRPTDISVRNPATAQVQADWDLAVRDWDSAIPESSDIYGDVVPDAIEMDATSRGAGLESPSVEGTEIPEVRKSETAEDTAAFDVNDMAPFKAEGGVRIDTAVGSGPPRFQPDPLMGPPSAPASAAPPPKRDPERHVLAATLEVPVEMDDDFNPFEGPRPGEVRVGLDRTAIFPAVDFDLDAFEPPPLETHEMSPSMVGESDIPLSPQSVRARFGEGGQPDAEIEVEEIEELEEEIIEPLLDEDIETVDSSHESAPNSKETLRPIPQPQPRIESEVPIASASDSDADAIPVIEPSSLVSLMDEQEASGQEPTPPAEPKPKTDTPPALGTSAPPAHQEDVSETPVAVSPASPPPDGNLSFEVPTNPRFETEIDADFPEVEPEIVPEPASAQEIEEVPLDDVEDVNPVETAQDNGAVPAPAPVESPLARPRAAVAGPKTASMRRMPSTADMPRPRVTTPSRAGSGSEDVLSAFDGAFVPSEVSGTAVDTSSMRPRSALPKAKTETDLPTKKPRSSPQVPALAKARTAEVDASPRPRSTPFATPIVKPKTDADTSSRPRSSPRTAPMRVKTDTDTRRPKSSISAEPIVPKRESEALVSALIDGDTLTSAERAQLLLALGRVMIRKGIISRDDLVLELLEEE